MKLYNTLTGKKETFKPKRGKKVNLFVCGPTVYDYAHLGHARTYIAFDVIAKYLKEKGFKVFYLQNITDIDDKIIQRAKEKNISAEKLAKNFEKAYLEDMESLRIDSITKYARATDYIKEIVTQVKILKDKGFAYQIADGLYYDISKFKNYGKLARRTALQAEDGVSRIDESKEKRNKGDFCLWKFSKEGEPKWPSPWGEGRPGWHIEDTAIAQKFFGTQYDVHGGAKDLIFPHHEAEIAQMEAISNKKPMVKYWLHTGFLTVNGKKMSKSLGNFITIKDFLAKHPYPYLRFFIIKSRYGSPLDFNEEFLLSSKVDLEYVWETREKLEKFEKLNFKCKDVFSKSLLLSQRSFEAAMEDDFNTPEALGILFSFLGECNALMSGAKLTSINARKALDFLQSIDCFFNFIFWSKPKEKAPQEVLELLEQREKARKEGLWQEADQIRNKIKKLGWQVEDTKDGPELKRATN